MPAPPMPALKMSSSLVTERERIRGLLEEAVALTPEEYLARKKTDPTFLAPNVGARRWRLLRRLAQLENMTQAQWDAQQHPPRRIPPSDPKPAATQKTPLIRPSGETPVPTNPPPIH